MRYRQEVFRDLEDPAVAAALRELIASLDGIRETLDRASRMLHPAERNRWHLDALDAHDHAVLAVHGALAARPIRSRGLAAARDRVGALVESPDFAHRRSAAAAARAALDGVAFRLRLGQQRVVVGRQRDEPDLARQIRETFARFSDGPAAPVPVEVFDTLDMNALEAAVLARVVKLAPEPFALLASTAAELRPVIDGWIGSLAGEAAWYLAVLDTVAPVRDAGLACAYPDIDEAGDLAATGVFDLALARQRVADGHPVATSDVALAASERLAVITGPSQAGRTSFARALGQLHVLAAAGCPVPASSARVPLVDAVHTVFDRLERLDDPGGRLRGELRQLRGLLAATTPASIVVANEPFASTTASDALALARRLVAAIGTRGARAVVVTFLEELASDPGAVSIAAVADPARPTARTFRFERRPADGLAHAQALAAEHGLAATTVRERMAR